MLRQYVVELVLDILLLRGHTQYEEKTWKRAAKSQSAPRPLKRQSEEIAMSIFMKLGLRISRVLPMETRSFQSHWLCLGIESDS